MDFLKAQLARLQHQFDQLTASQKMLSVSLVAIMVMTLLWRGRYAGQPEMEPLLSIPLSAALAQGALVDPHVEAEAPEQAAEAAVGMAQEGRPNGRRLHRVQLVARGEGQLQRCVGG